MKHKHADLIHAWADGAEIQYRSEYSEVWFDAEDPAWHDSNEYRIKPEEKKPVVRWLWATEMGSMTLELCSESERPVGFSIKLEWSRTEFPE